MIEQGLFKRHFVGRDGFIWWIGQIAPAKSWKSNIPANPNSPSAGFAERYKVRIMGYHTADPETLTDDQLPWAQVMYPITAGGGPGGAFQSANLTQGTFVFGFFMDGEDAQNPVIMGALGYNDYNQVMSNVPATRFIPFTGYEPKDAVAVTQVKAKPGQESAALGDNGGGTNRGTTVTESANGSNTQNDLGSQGAKEDPARNRTIATTEECKSKVGKIQQDIKNAIVEIEGIKKSIYSYQYAIAKKTADIQEKINKKIDEAAEYITEGIKWIIIQIQKAITKKINDAAKKAFNALNPGEQAALKEPVETANDLIACLFKKIIAALLNIVKDFLLGALNKVINTATCLVDNFLGTLFAGIADLVDGVMGQAFGAINAALGGIASIAGGALDIIIDVLSFLSCEEKPECAEVDEWDFWSGAGESAMSDLAGIVDKVTSFSGSVTDTINSSFNPDNFNFNIDFDSVFKDAAAGANGCFSGPRACGPPTANFFGGGVGAAVNLIVSGGGSVIGADIANAGINYIAGKTYAKVKDDCGKGRGAVIKPILGQVVVGDGTNGTTVDPTGTLPPGTVTTGIVGVDIIEGGIGYLPTFDGSLGGDGRTWANPDDTTVQHDDGSYEVPIPPGYVVEVVTGDTVVVPDNVITDANELIPARTPHVVLNDGKFTSPESPVTPLIGEYPITSLGSYPAIMYLCQIVIDNAGINYSAGDKVIIEPSNGAEAVATFDIFGTLNGIKVTKGGEGFTELPEIYIESQTGFNAILRPRLCIDRIGEDVEKPVTGDLVTVIDCVGKLNGTN